MPETRAHILSTKQLPQQYIDHVANDGIKITCKSFITIEPLSVEEFNQSVESAGDITTVIFTSEQAVKIVAGYINSIPDWNIYCISGATLQTVNALMPDIKIAGTADNGKELAELIIKDQVKEAVFFCSNIRLNTIPDVLKGNDIKVHEVVVYRTIPDPQQIDKVYDGIIFFSPSGMESFFSMNEVEKEVTFFAIGNTTANALSSYPNPIIISQRPEPAILIDTIVNHYKALETR